MSFRGMKLKKHPKPGSICEGTTLYRDTVPAMMDEVRRLYGNCRFLQGCRKTVREYIINWDDPNDRESPIFLAEDLEELLTESACDYLYFGNHPDDGACLGWWIDHESIYMDRTNGELPSGDQLPVANLTAPGYFLVISDHGNMTLYRRASNRWIECWGIV